MSCPLQPSEFDSLFSAEVLIAAKVVPIYANEIHLAFVDD